MDKEQYELEKFEHGVFKELIHAAYSLWSCLLIIDSIAFTGVAVLASVNKNLSRLPILISFLLSIWSAYFLLRNFIEIKSNLIEVLKPKKSIKDFEFDSIKKRERLSIIILSGNIALIILLFLL